MEQVEHHSPIRLVVGRGARNSETGVRFINWAPIFFLGLVVDTMTCPQCGATVERDPYNREERFICKCGWRSWKTRLELLQEFLAQEQEKDNAKS